MYIYIYIYIYTHNIHSCDYLQKTLIKVNVVTDEGKQPKWNVTLNKRFVLFIYFHLLTIDLKLLIYTKKKYLYNFYSKNIELIDVNSVTEQEMQSFPNQFLKSMWTSKQTHTHRFVHTFIKAPFQGTPPFLWSEFFGVHCINPACCKCINVHILQSRHGHCKDTDFLIFLLKMLKDCDNLISLGARSHIFGPRNERDSVPCLTEFHTL